MVLKVVVNKPLGVDLAKRVIQVHAVDSIERVVVAKALQRAAFLPWCAQLPPGCQIAMEACGGAHYWARKLTAMGFEARLIAGHFVTPYRMQGRGGKNDANDAAAVCCVFRPIVTTDFGIVTSHFGRHHRVHISAHRDRPFRHRDRPFRRS